MMDCEAMWRWAATLRAPFQLAPSVRHWCRAAPMVTRVIDGERRAEIHPRIDLARMAHWQVLVPVRDDAPIFPAGCLADSDGITEAMWYFAEGQIVDFAVVTPDFGKLIGRMTGFGLALGLWRQAIWALDGESVQVHETPARWWQNQRRGIVLLGTEDENAELLGGVREIVCSDIEQADRLYRRLSKPRAVPSIKVAEAALENAA